MNHKITFIDNPTIQDRADKFAVIEVDISKIVKDWKKSVYSFEWLLPDGTVRLPDKLTTEYRHQYNNIEQIYNLNGTLERPILGFGMMDNVEIGSRKEVLLTLASLGLKVIEVHVPKSCLEDFQKFM